ncbi:hypothetical protein QYE76_024817 [Lolium multiflorum]|uniref:DUF4220 domain-containing protein n=1 Tax=Lolium multiflorum TaxID=4521 RepID=A0AAD8REE4_LOLMU|nr:hypothetical protein QYE76_024817 [Lolium multiflorum]
MQKSTAQLVMFCHNFRRTNIMAGLLTLVNEWLIRGLVLLSFVAYLILVLFAGVRRHRASGWRMLLLWPAYQVASLATTKALANLFLGSASQELQLVAFWTPFLLMHLGRPDNISALSIEDNVLAARQVLEVSLQLVSVIFVLYKHIIVGGNAGTLLPASFIMFFLGIAKYIEGTVALWRGGLGNIRSSLKGLEPMGLCSYLMSRVRGEELDNEQALLAAHGLFYVSKGEFTDYPFGKNPLRRDLTREKEFSGGWKGVCKMVEMELSLMYDIMYTKAAVVHTWPGYGLRVISPPCTAAAFALFWLHSKEGQRSADVVITYILLVATFILDVRWLLGALGSTWTYAFINNRYWLKNFVETWKGLRLFLVFLAPSRLFIKEPTSYRRWSGAIGRYNLLHECTRETTSLLSRLVKNFASTGVWMEYQYGYLDGLEISPFIRDLLFKKVWEKLKSSYELDKPPPPPAAAPPKPDAQPPPKPKPPVPEAVHDPRGALANRRKLDEALGIGPEFQEVVLTWHIATEVFLLRRPREGVSFNYEYVKAIKELSSYMMFIVAVRPHMLPGLKLSSLHEVTREDLEVLWHRNKNMHCSTDRDNELASILQRQEEIAPGTDSEPGSRSSRSKLYNKSLILSDGIQYARLMLERIRPSNCPEKRGPPKDMRMHHMLRDVWREQVLDLQMMLERILDAWVKLLIYASIRCSRDSHAKQLAMGGELTTIVWILDAHARIDGEKGAPDQFALLHTHI